VAKAADVSAPAPALAPTPPRDQCAPSGDLALEAVQLASGEVVYRLAPN
jgi:hypothetical protein